jgi:hypothetical protein
MHPSSALCFRVKHEPNIIQRQMLGIVEMQISNLLEIGKDRQGCLSLLLLLLLFAWPKLYPDVVLKLEAASDTHSLDHGEIIVRCWTEEPAKASATAVAEARQAVQKMLESSAIKSMEAVVSKLKVFAEVADEAAKVPMPSLNQDWCVT